jgi:hypothetical protein
MQSLHCDLKLFCQLCHAVWTLSPEAARDEQGTVDKRINMPWALQQGNEGDLCHQDVLHATSCKQLRLHAHPETTNYRHYMEGMPALVCLLRLHGSGYT